MEMRPLDSQDNFLAINSIRADLSYQISRHAEGHPNFVRQMTGASEAYAIDGFSAAHSSTE